MITYRYDDDKFERPLDFDLVRLWYLIIFSVKKIFFVEYFGVPQDYRDAKPLPLMQSFVSALHRLVKEALELGATKLSLVVFLQVWRNWRDGSGSPISIWMPKAPNGYVSLGCVVCADFEKPDLDVVWCVHSDMTEETTLEDNPIWKAPSEAPWHCFVYPVISEVKTFVALREEKSENTPKPRKVIL